MRAIRDLYGLRTLSDLARRRKPPLCRLPRLWLLTDERRLPNPLPAVRALPRGAGVILRHYGDPKRAALAARLARLCRARGLALLIAGDGRLAAAVGADGIHLPEALAGQIAGWRRRRRRWLVTVAVHGGAALSKARLADAALLSPVFATASHPGATPLGPLRFAALACRSRLPVIALGGIAVGNLRRLSGIRLAGIAAIGALAAQTAEVQCN